MKLLQETEDAKDRKFIKSQVEKRRRERMNRSLERLRTMLLQEPQQGAPHRWEKAEILEHTVLFLQNTAKEDKTRAGGGGGGGGQKHTFKDGFSTCLQRAAQFLGPERKGMWLGSALGASFAARFVRSDADCAGVLSSSSPGSLPHTKSILRMLRKRSKLTTRTRASGASGCAHPYLLPAQQSFPRVSQQPQTQSQPEISAERRASKQSSSQSCPVSQTLWRPWP